jgi:hypothetical protein
MQEFPKPYIYGEVEVISHNVSKKQAKWPWLFAALPRVGDEIISLDGQKGVICGVTHSMNKETKEPGIILKVE